MAKKPTVTTISSGHYSTTALNQNFESIRDKFEEFLSLNGDTPNSLNADVDMNSNDLLNVKSLSTTSLLLNGQEITPVSAVEGSFKNILTSITPAITDTTLVVGDVVVTADGQFWDVVAAGTYTADNESVYDLTGISGQVASRGKFTQIARTLTELAAVDTASRETAYLSLVGREGEFTKVLTASYSALITADTENGMFVTSTVDATYAWMRAGVDMHNIKHFGAVGDGAVDIDETNLLIPTGTGAVTGTDDLAAVKGAVALAAVSGYPVYVPDGKYRCVIPNSNNVNVITVGTNFKMLGDGNGELIIDDDFTYGGASGQTGNIFIGTSQAHDSDTYDNTLNESFVVEGVIIRGTWWRDIEQGNRTWTGTQPYRVHALSPTNCKYVYINNVTVTDIMGFGIKGLSNQHQEQHKVRVIRTSGDAIRGEDSSLFIADKCLVVHSDDDAIVNPDRDDMPNSTRPRRAICKITNNTVVGSEGILVLGALGSIISFNHLVRTHGTGLVVSAQTSDASDRGEGGMANIIMQGNIVENHMDAGNRADPPAGGFSGTDASSITVNGAIAAALAGGEAIGDGTGTPDKEPWDNSDFNWGAMHLQDMVGSGGDEHDGSRSRNIVLTANNAVRTLPAATNFSDWGYGERFTRWGFDDPAITDARFSRYMMSFNGSFDGLVCYLGTLTCGDTDNGEGVRLNGTTVDDRYRNVKFIGGLIDRVYRGFSSDSGSLHYQDIAIQGVSIDCDPDRTNSGRVSTSGNHNKWSAVSVATCTGIYLPQLAGLTIKNNTFSNCANMAVLENNLFKNFRLTTFQDNLGICDFDDAGTSETDADNRGIGRIIPWGTEVTYQIRDLDPSSSTFNNTRSQVTTLNTSKPSTGHHVKGQIVRNSQASASTTLQWVSLTTSDNHVAGTDWRTIIVSSST